MKKAWIENNIIRDIAHTEPFEIYHPDIAKLYDTDVPDDAQNGWILENGTWVAPVIVETPVTPVAIKQPISPIEFKLRFTAPERVAIYASTDPIVKDFVSLLDDVRLTSVDLNLKATIDAIHYLASQGLIEQGRINEILG